MIPPVYIIMFAICKCNSVYKMKTFFRKGVDKLQTWCYYIPVVCRMQTQKGGTTLIDLRSIRKRKNLTLAQLSELTGLSDSYLCLIENADRTPSVPAAKRIAKVLGFDWTRFFDK